MRLHRIIAIIMILLQKRKINAHQLSEMFEVSLRTIFRDIKTIDDAGIPIISSPGVGGGIGIIEQYKIKDGLLTNEDISTILRGINSLSSSAIGRDSAITLAKINSLIPNSLDNEIHLKAEQISIDLSCWMNNKSLCAKIELIKAALEQQKTLAFSYRNKQAKKSQRIVEPYRLILKENHWYLQSYCLIKNNIRIFKLSRISQLEIKEDNYKIRNMPSPFDQFIKSMMYKEYKITLLVDHSIIERVLDYCDEKDVISLNDKQYKVNFNFIDDEYGYSILLGFGDKCVCLEPEQIRLELLNRINNLLKIYNT